MTTKTTKIASFTLLLNIIYLERQLTPWWMLLALEAFSHFSVRFINLNIIRRDLEAVWRRANNRSHAQNNHFVVSFFSSTLTALPCRSSSSFRIFRKLSKVRWWSQSQLDWIIAKETSRNYSISSKWSGGNN